MVPEVRRIIFSKTGRLKFISHLDLCRTMRSAFTRAGVPIYYSEGFNPHPKMVFALTVSTGAESLCEYLDVKITEPMFNEEIKDRLNGALSSDIRIKEVYVPSTKFTSVAWSSYEIVFFDGKKVSDIYLEEGKELVISRKTKSGEVTSDISPMIKKLSVFEKDGRAAINCVLAAGQNNYLNPEYVAKAAGGTDYDILRTGVFLEDGETEFR
ncbi:MAG: DUF2344 domain-containing protein [Ruminococcaceae bacterium]|nr:DUF2344 domain-containing protein [Oscillospiraceae bacterium]